MTTPPGLLGAALLLWGWQTGLFFVAAIIAVILECSRVVVRRWDLDQFDFNRVSDLCILGILGMAGYLSASSGTAHPPGAPLVIMVLFTWLPLTFAPLVFSQAYSARNKVDLSTLFLLLRRRAAVDENKARKTINLAYPYFSLCLISASTANVRSPWFYLGLCGLLAWALWFVRSKNFSTPLWVSLLLCVGFLGYGGHITLHLLQKVAEERFIEWFSNSQNDPDPYRNITAIGDLGRIKLSGRIMLRVEPGEQSKSPILLRSATYNIYRSSIWFATNSAFDPIRPEPDGTTWRLQPWAEPNMDLTISAYLKRGEGILALPNGAFAIKRLHVLRMQRNRLGTVKVGEGPGLVKYRVISGTGASLDSPPDAADLKIPPREARVISRMATRLELASQSPRETLKSLADFFRNNFQYLTFLGTRTTSSTPMEDFFLRSRSGHCEYFATATVMLLRAAGIPARYATGYSVQEFSRLENRYVVRGRHAHAWALVYVDGAWEDFDTTPAAWFSADGTTASLWEPVFDLWSWGVFLFSKWRWGEREGGVGRHGVWLLIPLVLLLVWRLYFKNRLVQVGTEQRKQTDAVRSRPGEDSEFYVMEKRLNELGFTRHPWEPLSGWIQRINAEQEKFLSTVSLPAIVSLHYRYRFDPHGISTTERAALKSNVLSWLEQHKTSH